MALPVNANKTEGEQVSPSIEFEAPQVEQEVVAESASEVRPEQVAEQESQANLQEVEQLAKPAPIPQDELPKKDQLTRDIEEILSEDLTEIYLSMPETRKQAFKQKGEEVASTIKEMMDKGKVEANKILGLILAWLGMIPGINKFFLQQEAKIKTDRIVDRFEIEMQSRAM